MTFVLIRSNSSVLDFIQIAEIHQRELSHAGISVPNKALTLIYRILLGFNLIQIMAKVDNSNLIQGFVITQNRNRLFNKSGLCQRYLLLLPFLTPYIVKFIKRSIRDIQLYHKINYDIKIIVFCVKREYQRTGIGNLLIEKLLISVERNKLVVLDTEANNFAANSFYTRHGFNILNSVRKHNIYGLRK